MAFFNTKISRVLTRTLFFSCPKQRAHWFELRLCQFMDICTGYGFDIRQVYFNWSKVNSVLFKDELKLLCENPLHLQQCIKNKWLIVLKLTLYSALLSFTEAFFCSLPFDIIYSILHFKCINAHFIPSYIQPSEVCSVLIALHLPFKS